MLSTSYSQVPSFLHLHSLVNNILLIFLKKHFIYLVIFKFWKFFTFWSFISTLFFFFWVHFLAYTQSVQVQLLMPLL